MSDLCATCEKIKAKINCNKELNKDFKKLQAELDSHVKASQVPQDLLSKAESEGRVAPDLRTIAIDLQQTLPCPKLRVSVAYYKRKVWL